jgi:hypothetical protein
MNKLTAPMQANVPHGITTTIQADERSLTDNSIIKYNKYECNTLSEVTENPL